jgi:hypothetical protein
MRSTSQPPPVIVPVPFPPLPPTMPVPLAAAGELLPDELPLFAPPPLPEPVLTPD